MTTLHRYAGLFGAPAVWAVNVQLGQVLPYADCAGPMLWSMLATGLALVIVAASVPVSLSGIRGLAPTDRFLAAMSGLVGLAFTFALLLQWCATLIVDPCAR